MSTETIPTPKELNAALMEKLEGGMQKEAQADITEYIRLKLREESFLDAVIPSATAEDSDLVPQVDTDKPVMIVELEPDSPGAITVPFGTLPVNEYIRGRKVRMMFQRMVTPRFVKDVDELRTYTMDIRQVLSDNALKDLGAEQDGKFIATIEQLLVAPGTVLPETGAAQWQNITGAITRETWRELGYPSKDFCTHVSRNNALEQRYYP